MSPGPKLTYINYVLLALKYLGPDRVQSAMNWIHLNLTLFSWRASRTSLSHNVTSFMELNLNITALCNSVTGPQQNTLILAFLCTSDNFKRNSVQRRWPLVCFCVRARLITIVYVVITTFSARTSRFLQVTTIPNRKQPTLLQGGS